MSAALREIHVFAISVMVIVLVIVFANLVATAQKAADAIAINLLKVRVGFASCKHVEMRYFLNPIHVKYKNVCLLKHVPRHVTKIHAISGDFIATIDFAQTHQQDAPIHRLKIALDDFIVKIWKQ